LDQARGMLLLELHGRQIAERRVQSAMVIKLVDKAREPRYHVFETAIVIEIDFLTFEGFHKTLGLGIVVGIATPAHRTDKTMLGQNLAIAFRGVLRPAVGMVDASWRGSARFYRDVQRCQRQPCIKTAGERVAYDPARPRIKHRCEIDEAFGNGDVTEIGTQT